MDIGGEPALIAGGGTIALRKIQKLLPFGPELTVVAPEICGEIRAIPGLRLKERKFVPGDEKNMKFVIAATDDRTVNRLIHDCCVSASIPVNTVDDAELCTFIFPALVEKGRLTLGISTSGSSPAAAVYLKNKINGLIPDNFGEILDFLDIKRKEFKKLIPEEKKRQAAMKELFCACMTEGRALSGDEFLHITEKEQSGNEE